MDDCSPLEMYTSSEENRRRKNSYNVLKMTYIYINKCLFRFIRYISGCTSQN